MTGFWRGLASGLQVAAFIEHPRIEEEIKESPWSSICLIHGDPGTSRQLSLKRWDFGV